MFKNNSFLGVFTRCPLYLFDLQKAKKDAASIVNASINFKTNFNHCYFTYQFQLE